MEVYEHILQEIHGKPQLLINERRVFLNAIYERVIVALTTDQLRSKKLYNILFDEIGKGEGEGLHLWINGLGSYKEYKPYIQHSLKANVPFTIVHNKRGSPFGLVLATTSVPSKRANRFIEDEHFHLKVEDLLEL